MKLNEIKVDYAKDNKNKTAKKLILSSFSIQNKEVASNIVILPKGTVEFDEIDKTPYIGRILQPLQTKTKKSDDTLTGRLLYDSIDK